MPYSEQVWVVTSIHVITVTAKGCNKISSELNTDNRSIVIIRYVNDWFDSFYVPRCQHDDGYIDGRSQNTIHTEEQTHVHSAWSEWWAYLGRGTLHSFEWCLTACRHYQVTLRWAVPSDRFKVITDCLICTKVTNTLRWETLKMGTYTSKASQNSELWCPQWLHCGQNMLTSMFR